MIEQGNNHFEIYSEKDPMILVFHTHPHLIENEIQGQTIKLCVKLTLVFENTRALDIFCLFFERNKVWFEANSSISIFTDLTALNWLNGKNNVDYYPNDWDT